MCSLVFSIRAIEITSKIIVVPDDYLTIQAAINATESNSVIYVRAGIYREHVVINKPLWLIGEDPNSTIIDGQQSGATVTIKANNILIKSFTITGGGVIWGLLGQGIGIAIYNMANCTIINNKIIGNRMGIYLHSSSNVVVSSNVIMNNREGIYLYNSLHNSIIKNDIISNEYFAIHLFSSNNTQIIGNNIMNNSLGIYLYSSSNNNTIVGNSIIRSGGVILSTSSHNNISKNIFVGNGLYILSSYENIVKDNVINNKPLVYLEGISDHIIKDAGQIILINCKNITIEGLKISNTGIGIELWQTNNTIITKSNLIENQISICLYASSHNNIFENIITNNALGIRIISSLCNNVSKNNITNNGYGIVLESSLYNNISQNLIMLSVNYGILLIKSLGNIIYNNEFVDNSEQVLSYESINTWNNNYPSGGNYWSNYIGIDLHSGAYQNETGNDGIGDTPYCIDKNNIDRYPLMKKVKAIITTIETRTIIRFMNYNDILIKIIIIVIVLMLFLFTIYIGMRIKKKGLFISFIVMINSIYIVFL